MALSENFYNEIFEKEKYWTELANRKLLNIYYLNGKDGIKEFYLDKKAKLEQEYTNDQMIGKFLSIIDNIISKIDSLTLDYRRGNPIDINSIITLFLHNQMNNQVKNGYKTVFEDDSRKNEMAKLQLRKQVLQSLNRRYKDPDEYSDDYLYEEPDYKGKVA